MLAVATAERLPVRVRRAPELEPPFDDEVAEGTVSAAPAAARGVQAATQPWTPPAQPAAQPGRGVRTQRPVTPRTPRGPLGPFGPPAPPTLPAAVMPPSGPPSGGNGGRNGSDSTPRPVGDGSATGTATGRAGAGRPVASDRPALVPTGPVAGPQGQPGQRARPVHRGQPTPGMAAAQRFVGVCVEILNGHRPATHLRAITAPADLQGVTDQLVRRTTRTYLGRPGAMAPPPHRIRLIGLHVCEPRDGVAEIAAVLGYGAQSWAMAARLERKAETWLCKLVQVV
jgi:hypothetical protein